jgi:lipoprotein-releasing system permease protein
MIVLEKQKDISVLKSMGASEKLVRNIFLTEGLLLSLLGLLIGLALALILYTLQKTVGLIRIPDGFLVREYPISLRLSDFVPVVATVLFIGLLSALPAALRAMKTPAYLREE